MAKGFPSLAFLEAFAKAAELGSLSRAAEALHLSPSALTRRIQALEDEVGTLLFRREPSGLELTPEGRRYADGIGRVFAELRRAQQSLRPSASQPLRISALQSFTESCLVPRLPAFERLHPEITLEVTATLAYADFDRDPVDVAIRFGTGPWEGLHGEPLVDLHYLPVCSPLLLHGDRALERPADLERHTLIHLSQVPRGWADWLREAGLESLEPARSVTYDHLSIALAAAESAQGVALCAPLLCQQRLASGRLCVPFEIPLASSSTYHLVCRPESLDDPRVVALRDWLVDSLA